MSKRIRVARVSTVPFFVITQLSAPIRALSESGAEVVVIASDDDLGDSMAELDCSEYVPVHIAREINPLSDLKSLVRLISLFRQRRFDIVHSTTPKAGLLCAIAGLVARVPVRLHSFTGQPWVTMSGLKRRILKACDRVIGLLDTRCYTDSQSQRRFLVEEGIVSARKLHVLGEGSLAGVNLQRFDPSRYSVEARGELKVELGIDQDTLVLLFVGRITKDKGVVELLEAFSGLLEAGKDVVLVMVGPYETDGETLLSRYLADPQVASRLKLVGFTGEPERYMSIATVLCLPSYREGFGTVVIEAAAMEVPTVGTSIYGLTDAVVDGITGKLVPVGDARALQEALLAIVEDPLVAHNLSAAARQRAVERFDSRRYSQLLIDEYHDLLNN
ncbi:glycosyltransferase family 4 protein [Pseudomonas sp. BNK-43-a]|uniref:glycosyltransferase family 4 protein n=1 Tax=unclassified Pseudomonas TaxID=196821 RepID=UPI0039BF2E4A